MKVKVCGMKFPDNIQKVQVCEPDFLGFIFYKKSPRYVGGNLNIAEIDTKRNTKKVGVFVNSPIDEVVEMTRKNKLDFVQLHGTESIQFVKELSDKNIKIIKAFQINDDFNWLDINSFTAFVKYFLFDTATKNFGGSGLKFDWSQLSEYQESIPFFLSGGIGINDLQEIRKLKISKLYGIDINSKFETVPGMKNIELIKSMINQLKNEPTL